MELYEKEVRFDLYCKTCKHRSKQDYEDPCNDCLDTPVRKETSIPLYWRKANA